MQAESGLMAITGERDGEPMRVGVAITDIVCGMVATQSILAALYERTTTGKGQFLDLSLIDCALSLLINVGSGYLNTGREVARYGNAHPTVVPYQIFEAADGGFALAVGNDRQFAALCEQVVDLPHLAKDPRFIKAGARATNREALIPQLAAVFRTRTRDHWMAACAAASVPAGTVKSIPEVFDSPNVRERSPRPDLAASASRFRRHGAPGARPRRATDRRLHRPADAWPGHSFCVDRYPRLQP